MEKWNISLPYTSCDVIKTDDYFGNDDVSPSILNKNMTDAYRYYNLSATLRVYYNRP